MVTHLEIDIVEWEVKWTLGRITKNKASEGDGIIAEVFQILKDDAVKVLHSIYQQLWKTQQWPQDWRRSVITSISKTGSAKKYSNYPGGSEVKASACNAGDLGSIPGFRRSPGERNGNPLQYPCLENPMDKGACWAAVHRVAKSRTRLSDFTSLSLYNCAHFTC